MLAGPISNLKIYNRDQWGNTGMNFLVTVGEGITPVRVSAKTKYDWMLEQAQKAKSVVVTKGYMNGWMTRDNPSVQKMNVGARSSGLFFYDWMLHPHAEARVEGIIQAVYGNWATLLSSYTAPSDKDKARHRIVMAKFAAPVPAEAVGNLAVVLGKPTPKFNDQWYLHLPVEVGWILYGKK